MTDVSFGLAFLAGVVSFLSPCVLPIVPAYVTFVTGLSVVQSDTDRARAIHRHAAVHASLFWLGFSLLFIGLGATATVLGQWLMNASPLLERIGGVMLIGFGLLLAGLLPLALATREAGRRFTATPAGKAACVLTGVAFGAGWTPCIGPVLASVLLAASTKESMSHGIFLLAAYTLGLGVPFLIVAVGLNWFLEKIPGLGRWVKPLRRGLGAILILFGVALVAGQFSVMTRFLARYGQLFNLEV